VLTTNEVEKIGPVKVLSFASQLAAREPVYYLHPSSGFFLERFSDAPAGFLRRLLPRQDEPDELKIVASCVATNHVLWQQRWSAQLQALAEQLLNHRDNAARWSRAPLRDLRLARRQNATAAFLGSVYSKAFNHWGVELRRSGHDPEAREWFERSLEMNPDNLAARINLEYARRCERGDRSRLKLAVVRSEFSEALDKYENWWEVISQNGPVDEPTFLLQSGRVLLAAHNPRQAVSVFARCAELAPAWPLPKLWQAQSHNLAGQFTEALTIIDRIDESRQNLKGPGLAQLLVCKTLALRGLGRTNDAKAYLEQFINSHGQHVQVLAAAAGLFAANSQFDRELDLRETLLQRDSNNPELIARKGLAELRLARYEAAAATFSKALTLSPDNTHLRLLRAVAYLRGGQLEASKADYRELLKNERSLQSALFGLGGIAWREHETNVMVRYYEQFLSNSAAMTPQFNIATERLRQIRDE
jgi:tetratricopeptide (TPR) repeat protein